ncbi:hypothetical protein V8F33_013338 [Rhypophila sp. PSN 637]
MAFETDSKQIDISTVGGEPPEQDETSGKTIVSHVSEVTGESDDERAAGKSLLLLNVATASVGRNSDIRRPDLEPPKPALVEKSSSLDICREGDDQCDNSDKDSAKAGLDDHADDDLDSDLVSARTRHMERLADIFARMEQASRDHDAAIETAFCTKINSLDKIIMQGNQERDRLGELIQQKEGEIHRLRQEMALEEDRHSNELSQQKRSAEEERRRAGEQWEQELHEALEKRGREHQQAVEDQQQQHLQAMEQLNEQHEQAMASLREELTKESEQRISNLEELGREAEQRVNKVRAEMGQMKVDFEREREQTMKEMKGEMARLVEREREARERCRRLEMGMAHRGHGQTRDESPAPHLRQSSSWAIARLWGVGQTRARSFS